MINAFDIAASRPWLIQREMLETILTVAQRQGDLEALQTRVGRPLDNTRSVVMRDGVAVIPVTGPIFRYANLFTEISGATSTEVLARDITAAVENSYVRGIVLDLNSPGGEAVGINELSKLIASVRGRKPIKAYGGGSMCSGAYWLGAACDEIIIDETAALGSIGVVMSFTDTSERDAKSGIRVIEIVSSQSPDKRVDPATDSGRAKVQSTVDALAEVFVNAVATYRDVDVSHVLSDFGRGDVLIGARAIEARMADRIGSLESVIAELAGSASISSRKSPMANTKTGEVTVSNTADLRQALAAGYTADQINVVSSNEAEVSAAHADGMAKGRAEATDAAVQSERERIAGINAIARAGFDAEAQAAISAGDSPATFALSMLQAAQDRGITLDAMRSDSPPPAAHASPPQPSAAKPSINPNNVFAMRRKAVANTQDK